MKPETLVSVIIPVFNAERYLKTCLQSVQAQTHDCLEIIVVNDGSNDTSRDISISVASEDSRIRLVNKENGGVSSARNLGISLANGNYICFVDSDDTIHKEMITVMLDRIQQDGSDLCALYKYHINRKRSSINARITSSAVALENLLLLKFPTSLWAILYRKESIERIRLSEDIHFFEDFLFNFGVLKLTNRVSLCDLMLYNYRITDSSVNAQIINKRKMSCLLIYDRLLIDNDIKTNIDSKAQYFRMHCLLTCLLAASKSPYEASSIHFPVMQKHARHMFKDVFFSPYIGMTRKVICLCAAVDTHITCIMIKLFYRIIRKEVTPELI